MKNSLVLLAVVLSVAAFAGMMRIKTDVQTMDRERLRLVRERAELRETKRVLEAEWALLASPERMARLAAGKNYVPASSLDIVPLAGPAVSGTVVSATMAVAALLPVSATAAATPTVPMTPADADADTAADTGGSAIDAFEALQQAEAAEGIVSGSVVSGTAGEP